MHIRAGTSGYAYTEWKGSFYPDDLKADDMLSYYATQLSVVEINNTFYRMPRRDVLENWASQVPDDFRFVIKASRRITHIKRLKEVGEETNYLLTAVRVLGDKLGPILFQLPPNMKKDIDRLRTFTQLLPEDIRAALEFRNDTWFDDDTYGVLRDAKCALCIADVDDSDEPELVPTADWGYLRLRRQDYSKRSLQSWFTRISEAGWNDAFVFFKHEDGATGPAFAKQFMAMA
jgi:uncharacterized protein YecE (DUF72 family)